MAKSVPTIAVTSTLAMVRMAEARGAAAEQVLRALGVERDVLEVPDARLPATTVLAVWNALRERTGDPALQLHAPSILPFGAYRVIDYLVAASPTLGEGVRQFARFFGLIAEGVALTIERHGDGFAL
ncbi:MAG TPA: AraC family transcriptional regulator ligand-binding domain-containing protein, partial [Gemmatimonadaceae bacterium]|nr:AraC family transcriptional regulator ligand-binding domain-containing protein [Gemmatimonadaceae bacterium]